jgi:hypothetical protein
MVARTLLTAMMLLLAAAPAAAAPFLNLEKPQPYELMIQGFELDRPATVEIDAVGRGADDHSWVRVWRDSREDDDVLTVYAWILDAATREPVWVMDAWETDRVRGALRRAEDRVDLEAGRYEVYFFSGHGWLEREEEMDREGKDRYRWGRSWSREVEDLREDLQECHVRLSSGTAAPRLYTPEAEAEGAVVSFQRVGDSQLLTAGLNVKSASRLQVYSLIEFPKGSREPADYGWIVDAESRQVVWTAAEALTRRAGGSRKNREVDEEISLPPGRYEVHYGTDDSHSWEKFNANPPFDPMAWGMVLTPVDGADVSTYEPDTSARPRIDLTGVGDAAFEQAHFRLTRDGTVRVKALGEYSYGSREFVDYAWILDEESGETAWEMTERNTRGAGGAEKNRTFDGLVTLPAGIYTVLYVTDDSHAYGEWNAATPFEPTAWGVQVFEHGTPLEIVETDALPREAGVLVKMVRVGDNERRRESFRLEEQTRLHVTCVGEGDDGRFYDHGWILDDATGRTVWEMTWRNTVHAGGARKNRAFDDEIVLPAGSYTAYYETDGSHSFEGWNDRRPRDPMAWGLTVRRVQP